MATRPRTGSQPPAVAGPPPPAGAGGGGPAPPLPEPGEGQALLRVERFGLTANVITYALAGDTIGYWRFFPASEDGWGRIPAWGFAEVVGGDVLEPGERLFGYLPMASHVLLSPEVRPTGVAAPHPRPGAVEEPAATSNPGFTSTLAFATNGVVVEPVPCPRTRQLR